MGEVKTRLQPTLSAEQALALHVACIEDLCSHLIRLRADFEIFIFQSEPGDLPEACGTFPRRLQQGVDLGDRMLRAADSLLENHPSALLLGTDLPQLDTTILYQARESLARADVVLGPSLDGGYYLLGLCRSLPFLFRNVAWGTEEVLPETLRRLKDKGVTYHLMEEAFDLDRVEDLKRLLSSPAAVRAPRTVALIERLACLFPR